MDSVGLQAIEKIAYRDLISSFIIATTPWRNQETQARFGCSNSSYWNAWVRNDVEISIKHVYHF